MYRGRSPAWRHLTRYVLPTLLIDGVAPFAVYALLRPLAGDLHALIIAMALPLFAMAVTLVRQRRVNVVGLVVLGSLLLSGVVLVLGGSPRLILIRESLLSGLFSIAMLISLAWRRPLVYHIAAHFYSGHAPGRIAQFRARAAALHIHNWLRLLTLVWGAVMLADALLNTYLATTLSTAAFLAVSPTARYVLMGATLIWTLAYAQRGGYLAALFAPDTPRD